MDPALIKTCERLATLYTRRQRATGLLHEAQQDRILRIQKCEAQLAALEEALEKSGHALTIFENDGEADGKFYDTYRALLAANKKDGEALTAARDGMDEVRRICDQRIGLAKMRIEPPPHFSETLPVWRYLQDRLAFLKDGDSVWVQVGDSREYARGVLKNIIRDPMNVQAGRGLAELWGQTRAVSWTGGGLRVLPGILARLDGADREGLVLASVFYEHQLVFLED